MKNWPTIVSVFASALLAGAVKLGWLTTAQVAVAAAILQPLWTAMVHRLMPPAVKGQLTAKGVSGVILVGIALLLAGCGNAPPPQLPPYDACVMAAALRAGTKVVVVCKPTGWLACPLRDEIRSTLQTERTACTGESVLDDAFDKSMALAFPAP